MSVQSGSGRSSTRSSLPYSCSTAEALEYFHRKQQEISIMADSNHSIHSYRSAVDTISGRTERSAFGIEMEYQSQQSQQPQPQPQQYPPFCELDTSQSNPNSPNSNSTPLQGNLQITTPPPPFKTIISVPVGAFLPRDPSGNSPRRAVRAAIRAVGSSTTIGAAMVDNYTYSSPQQQLVRPRLVNLSPEQSPSASKEDPDGLRPNGPIKDPSGKLIHDESGRLVNTASGRLIPEQLQAKLKAQRLEEEKEEAEENRSTTSRTTFATTKTSQSSSAAAGGGGHGNQPVRRVSVPCGDSVCPSVLTADTDGLILLNTTGNSTNSGRRPSLQGFVKEFLLLVEFHWKAREGNSGILCCGWRKTLQPDQPTLPYVMHPYMRSQHWQVFLHAVNRLALRNHRVGLAYLLLGLLANVAGLAYILYGLIPIPNHEKFCSLEIALGSGFGLLTAGVCLCIWGRANRGGVLYQQDLENLCANVSEQIQGIWIQYRTVESLKRRQRCEQSADHSCRSLAFGLELFCLTEDPTKRSSSSSKRGQGGGEEPTESTTHPTLAINRDVAHIMGADPEQPSSEDAIVPSPPPSSTDVIVPSPTPTLQRTTPPSRRLEDGDMV